MKSYGIKSYGSQRRIYSFSTNINFLSSRKNLLQGREVWEFENYTEIEGILTRWQDYMACLSSDSIFNIGLLRFFSDSNISQSGGRIKDYSVRIKDFAAYMNKYFRWDIFAHLSHSGREITPAMIQIFRTEVSNGILISGNRIYPVLYYPFMDGEYFNHSNWDGYMLGVSIGTVVPFRRNEYSIKSKKISNCGCGNGGSGCADIKNEIYSMDDYNDQQPVLYIIYGDNSNHVFLKPKANCFCVVHPTENTKQDCQLGGKGVGCGKSDRSGKCAGSCGGTGGISSHS